jgi:multiple sugar transport system permease protein/putative aldouronate transport system permease protein
MFVEKRKINDYVFDALIWIIVGLFSLICLYPFWYVLMASLSDPRIPSLGLLLFPRGITLFSYREVIKQAALPQAVFISALRTVSGTCLSVISVTFLGYIFSKDNVPCKKLFYRYFIITMYISGGLIPTFLTYRSYGLLNNFLVYILPGIVSVFNLILVKTYIETSIPSSLEESAAIDGAGYLTVFFMIIFPLVIPIVATVSLFTAVGQWNSWFDNMIYTSQKQELMTLQYLLYKRLSEASALANAARQGASTEEIQRLMEQMTLTPNSIRMTITMIVTLPIICVYPLMQRYFIKGIMIGSIKG